MQSQHSHSELSVLQAQLLALKESFDLAIKKDLTLGEVKNIYHEMRVLSDKLNQLEAMRDDGCSK